MLPIKKVVYIDSEKKVKLMTIYNQTRCDLQAGDRVVLEDNIYEVLYRLYDFDRNEIAVSLLFEQKYTG